MSEMPTMSLHQALEAALAAMPHKRWTLTLEGDWEDGWVASATSRSFGVAQYVEVTTEGQGWGADRNGAPTPHDALERLTALLKTPNPLPSKTSPR